VQIHSIRLWKSLAFYANRTVSTTVSEQETERKSDDNDWTGQLTTDCHDLQLHPILLFKPDYGVNWTLNSVATAHYYRYSVDTVNSRLPVK
jgi:hypothetical protein